MLTAGAWEAHVPLNVSFMVYLDQANGAHTLLLPEELDTADMSNHVHVHHVHEKQLFNYFIIILF